MTSRRKDNIILCGFRGCGKSTYGRMLAQTINWKFVDTDAKIEQAFEKRYRQRLLSSDIYNYLGDKAFRELEANTIMQLTEDTTKTIISLGGGAIINTQTLEHLHNLGTMIYLHLDKEPLKIRMQAQLPAFLDTDEPFDKVFEAHYNSRVQVYPLAADITLKTFKLTPRQIIDRLKILMRDPSYVFE